MPHAQSGNELNSGTTLCLMNKYTANPACTGSLLNLCSALLSDCKKRIKKPRIQSAQPVIRVCCSGSTR
eukprot:1150937-Rhodomonas_salina.2